MVDKQRDGVYDMVVAALGRKLGYPMDKAAIIAIRVNLRQMMKNPLLKQMSIDEWAEVAVGLYRRSSGDMPGDE